jgi:Uma2 family endonuclease
MAATANRMTVEEFLAITVEGDRKQLIDGAVVVNDEPKLVHGVLQARLCSALQAWVESGPGRGLVSMPTNVELDAHNLFGPDIVWIAEEHLPPDLNRYPERVPDLCVEIRSPGTWRYDVGAKKAAYERGGLPELWLVDDVACSVLVFRRSTPEAPVFDVALELGVGDELTSPQLPGFALPLGRLFSS